VMASATFCRAVESTLASSVLDSFLASCTWLTYAQRFKCERGYVIYIGYI
jgi:hypothetical protein